MKNPKSIRRKRQETPGRISVVKDMENIEDVKRQIAEVITAASVQMTESVIRAVNERGSVVGLRFLWSIAGMLPRPALAEPDPGALSMKTLIEKLGLHEKSSTQAGISRGKVK